MKATIIVEVGTDGTYDARTSEEFLNYMVLGQGNTVQEALDDYKEVYNELRDVYKSQGKDFVEITDFVIKYDTASFLEHYSKFISLAGLERLTGVNQGQLSHYLTGRRRPSQKTIEKIQSKLHSFGKELQHLEFA